MRPGPIKNIEAFRVREGPMASSRFDGNNGAWLIPGPIALDYSRTTLTVIASDGLGWEHVSVSTPGRTPTWEEMCYVKDLFWAEEECVIQYHPPKAVYRNCHQHCLHMWRPVGAEIPMPDPMMVAPPTRTRT
jgi:hypothetical protein